MKRFLTILMSCTLLLALSACGKVNQEEDVIKSTDEQISTLEEEKKIREDLILM